MSCLKFYYTMKNTNQILLLAVTLFLFSAPVICQSQSSTEAPGDQTLKTQFQEMLDKSESYTEYKVIKRTKLTVYSRAVQDSLKANRNEINTLKNKVNDQESQISQLSNRITELEDQLKESEELREGLTFLGINIHKITYHMIVWTIIGVLAAFGIFSYTSFVRSNIIRSKTNKEFKTLEVELEEHKKKSHEKQIKVARELQTERNKVEELKTKIKTNNPGKL